MRRSILAFGIVSLLAVGSTTTANATCDVPLVISNGGGQAVVMILLDNSGSMNEALTPDQFQLAQPPGAQVIRLDGSQGQGSASAKGSAEAER